MPFGHHALHTPCQVLLLCGVEADCRGNGWAFRKVARRPVSLEYWRVPADRSWIATVHRWWSDTEPNDGFAIAI